MADHNPTQAASDPHAEYKKRMADAKARADRVAACKLQVDRDEAEFLKEVNRRPEIAEPVIGWTPLKKSDGSYWKRSDGKLSGAYGDPIDPGLKRAATDHFNRNRSICNEIK